MYVCIYVIFYFPVPRSPLSNISPSHKSLGTYCNGAVFHKRCLRCQTFPVYFCGTRILISSSCFHPVVLLQYFVDFIFHATVSPNTFHEQIFSKQQMSSVELSSCCLQPTIRLFLPLERNVPVLTTKTTQPRPKVISVNCSFFWQLCCTIDVIFHISQNSSKFGRQQLVIMNYAWDISQSETEKYCE